MFNCFRKWKKFDGENPVSGICGPKESEGRTRTLTFEEEAALLEASGEPLRTMIIVGVNTGLRIHAEGLTLRRDNVDLHGGYLTVEAAYAKNKETETIPLNSTAREALRAHMARTSGEYVFTSRNGKPFKSIRTIFTTACEHVNLTGVTPHCLRHTFASRLGDAGVSDGDIQAVGRWKDAKMITRYKHLTEKHLRESVEKIAGNSPMIFTTPQEQETRKSFSARSSVG
jgi:integrase